MLRTIYLKFNKYVYLNDSGEHAEKIINGIYKKCLTLESFPKRGRIPTELKLLEISDFL